jgi:hypothetical protein
METIANNVQSLKDQYKNLSSGHWFDDGSMRFFNTRLTSQYRKLDDKTALFITTERGFILSFESQTVDNAIKLVLIH